MQENSVALPKYVVVLQCHIVKERCSGFFVKMLSGSGKAVLRSIRKISRSGF